MEIKRLSECTFLEYKEAWNRGFEEYYVNMEMTLEQLFSRMVYEGLSPEISIVAFKEEMPIGIVLNGIRERDGKRIAWNGGTGISPEHRNKGLGKQLMEATLRIYEEEKIEVATLEVLLENKRAISLYEKAGFSRREEIIHYQQEVIIQFPNLKVRYRAKNVYPHELRQLSIFTENTSWQTRIESVQNGEGVVLFNDRNEAIAYALFKKKWDGKGKQKNAIYLYQCGFADRENYESRVQLVKEVFGMSAGYKYVVNFPAVDQVMVSLFEEMGFKEYIRQVWMERVSSSDAL